MKNFNILREPSIKAQFSDNSEQKLSLRDIILESYRISEIVSDSVTEAAAIRRFLLALFIRVYADYLKHEEWWVEVFQTGVLPTEPLEQYLQQWEDRFDLFHPAHPFFQHPSPESDKPQSLSALRLENASGNNAVWFSHSNEEDSFMMTNAEAARALIAAQAYALCGGVSKPFNFSHSVLVSGGLVFWLRGKTMLESLLLNAPHNFIDDPDTMLGTPSWEHEPVRALQYPANGILHLFTFLSRRFCLVRHDDNTVKAVRRSQGDKNTSPLDDPMMAYITNSQGEKSVLNFNRERALWRSYYALYAEQTKSSHKPLILQYALDAVLEGQHIELEVFGLQTDKSGGKSEHSRMEKLVYYPSIVGDKNKVSALQKMILDSDTVSGALSKALWLFAQVFLHPDTQKLSDTQRTEITNFKQSIDCSAQYWANAGTRINSFIARLSRLEDADERGDLVAEWHIFLKSTAMELLEGQLESISGNASLVYRAFAAAQRFFQIESSKF